MKSAAPIAPPGCPDLAFSTMATIMALKLSAARLSIFSVNSMDVLFSSLKDAGKIRDFDSLNPKAY